MDNLWIYALGFLGQGLFGARLIIQLVKSEKAGKVVSPTIFWQLSLAASFIFLIYGIIRNDIIIVGGQTISYYIYVRNLQLKNAWIEFPKLIRRFLLLLPVATLIFVLTKDNDQLAVFQNPNIFHPLMILGAIGQLALNLRFIYQWYYSEKFKTSILPLGFWHISTWASVLVILYAIYNPITGKMDPVLLVSQGLGIFAYARNIIIFKKDKV